MDFESLAHVSETAFAIMFATLAAVIAHRCLTGRIALGGILAHDTAALAEGRPAGERVQMLGAFVFTLGAYVQSAINQHGSASLPDAPPQLVALFAASHGIYLTGKFGRAAQLGRRIFKKGE